jgi:hypothetical protein
VSILLIFWCATWYKISKKNLNKFRSVCFVYFTVQHKTQSSIFYLNTSDIPPCMFYLWHLSLLALQ